MNSWQEDFDFLLDKILKIHPNPYHITSKEEWDRISEESRNKLEKDDPVNLAEFFKLIALLYDSHSRISLSFEGDHTDMQMKLSEELEMTYPFQTYVFSDDVYFIQAHDTKLFHQKIESINDVNIKEVASKLRPYLPIENESGFISFLPYVLKYPLFLKAIDLIDNLEDMIEIQFNTGKSVKISPTNEKMISLIQENKHLLPQYWNPNRKLSIRQEGENLIVDIPAIADTEELTMKQLAQQLDSKLTQLKVDENREIKRLIIDIRRNGGGNNYLNQNLVLTIIRHSWINQPGKVFCLIDRWTFSAAINLANSLERWTWTIFAGEAYSARVNHYGDPKLFLLPNTGLETRVSTLYWQDSDASDHRLAIIPDIPVELSYIQFIEGKDPVMNAIENYSEDWTDMMEKYLPRYKRHRESQRQSLITYFT